MLILPAIFTTEITWTGQSVYFPPVHNLYLSRNLPGISFIMGVLIRLAKERKGYNLVLVN